MSTQTSLFSTEAVFKGGTGANPSTGSAMLMQKGRARKPQPAHPGGSVEGTATAVRVEPGEASSSLAAAALIKTQVAPLVTATPGSPALCPATFRVGVIM